MIRFPNGANLRNGDAIINIRNQANFVTEQDIEDGVLKESIFDDLIVTNRTNSRTYIDVRARKVS